MKFEQDGLRFVGIMAIIAVFGIVYTVVVQIYGCMSIGQAVVKALDLVTITIPPGLNLYLYTTEIVFNRYL